MPEPITLGADAASPAAPLSTNPLAALSPEQRLEWRKTGVLPGASAPDGDVSDSDTDDTPDSSSDTADTPAGTPASSEPESDPAPLVAEPAQPEGYKAKTAKRIQELLDRAAKAEQRADALERQQRQIDARTAAPSPALAADPKPDAATYEDLTKYFDDVSAWNTRQALRDRDAHATESAATAARQANVEALEKKWNASVAVAKTKAKDFDADAVGKLIPIQSSIDMFVQALEPDSAGTLLAHLHKHPAEIQRILAIDPIMQFAELTRVFDRASAGPKPKLRTDAPEPGPVLGTRVTAGDPVAAALKTRDQRAYNREQNRREMAARRGQ